MAEFVAEEPAGDDDRVAGGNHHDMAALLGGPALHGVGEVPGVVAILASIGRGRPARTDLSGLSLSEGAGTGRRTGAGREGDRQRQQCDLENMCRWSAPLPSEFRSGSHASPPCSPSVMVSNARLGSRAMAMKLECQLPKLKYI